MKKLVIILVMIITIFPLVECTSEEKKVEKILIFQMD